MTTKNRYIAIIVLITLILLGFLGWWLASGSHSGATGTGGSSSFQKTLQNFFPFGNPAGTSTAQAQGQGSSGASTGQTINESGSNAPGILPRLRELSSEPVAGAGIFSLPISASLRSTSTSTASSSDFVIYVEKGTGHVYREYTDSPTQELLSATTIPKIDTAYVGANRAVAYQYFKSDNETLETFLGHVADPVIATTSSSNTTPASGKVSGIFLPQDIYRFDIGPAGDRIFYLTQGVDSDTGYVANIDGSKSTQVFSTPLRELDLSWPTTDTVLLNTSPDSSVDGYLFALDVATKNVSQVLGGIPGLTAIANPDLSDYIYSASTFNGFVTHVYKPSTNFDATTSITTLPEKCAWSTVNVNIAYCAVPTSIPQAGYPESWYLGDVSFSDNIWKLDLKAGTSTEILNFSQQSGGQSADMIDLSVSQGDRYLIFTNKKDNILWGYRLTATANGFI